MDSSTSLITTSTQSHTFRVIKKFTHTWTIHNFRCPETHTGRSLPYTNFKFGENGEYSGVLNITGDSCRKRYCQLQLQNNLCSSWKPTVHLWVEKKSHIDTPYNDPNYGGSCRPRNVWEIFLEDNGRCLIPKEKSTIMCEIDYVEYKTTTATTNSTMIESKLSQDLAELFESRKFWDVTILVSGHEVHAHKFILAARSKVFAVMFDHDTEEAKTNKVTVTDIDLEVFEEMLRFIYTGKVKDLSEMTPRLLAASDKYDLSVLKSMCENELANKVSSANAAETLVLADLYSAEELKKSTFNFIKNNKEAVAAAADWKKFIDEYPRLVAELYMYANNLN